MKFTAIKAAVAICLMVPVMAMAGQSFSDIAIQTFNLDSKGSTIFSASWTDLIGTIGDSKESKTKTFYAESLDWQLFDSSDKKVSGGSYKGSFDDETNVKNTASIVINEARLSTGAYKLKFTGTWEGEDKMRDVTGGSVKLVSISPVPEPESYAMFLAGLGLVGTIALRRRKASAS
jgi:hypothetical protein